MDKTLSQEGIADNLRFMVLEVVKQIENAQKALESPNAKLIESIESRDDYIDNLKSVIENKCYSAIHSFRAERKRSVDLLRATITVASNLERIADFAENIVAQLEYLKTPEFIQRYSVDRFFKEVLSALDLAYTAVTRQDMAQAFRICRSEFNLDLLYKVQFDRILNELRSGQETENLITSHLILRYLERMGDALLNIGEAIIFAAVGEKFKIRQYEALKETLAMSGMEMPISDVEFQSIWGTRSGCRISKVAGRKPEAGGDEEDAKGKRSSHGVLFKEGNRKKLLQERQNIERWEAMIPGLPPKILAHQEEENQASLLIEFLSGCSCQDVFLNAEEDVLQNALFLVEQTLTMAWEQTKAYGPAKPDYISQLSARLSDVFRLHPSLKYAEKSIGGLVLPSIEEHLAQTRIIEEELTIPYTVFIHGDFNSNNIVYDHANQRIHYVDLHRSRQADPLQDISVFLVSNFRLPFFDPHLRARLNRIGVQMYRFARGYAMANKDLSFDARLSLGLVRSFISSARFELDNHFAKTMFLRGVYLMEKLLRHQGRPWETFAFPETVLAL